MIAAARPAERPSGRPRRKRAAWRAVMEAEYGRFREQVVIAQRFGGAEPWLDPYGAENPGEFFAVAGEAYFVARERFGHEFPALLALFDGFFRRAGAGPA